MSDTLHYTYRGYKIVRALHPTPFERNKMTWDIVKDDNVLKPNVGSVEIARRIIDIMLKREAIKQDN